MVPISGKPEIGGRSPSLPCHAHDDGFRFAQPILRLLSHRHIPERPIRLRVVCVRERERSVVYRGSARLSARSDGGRHAPNTLRYEKLTRKWKRYRQAFSTRRNLTSASRESHF